MPLRLRRGTNTERQLITPQEGELIYVTDTKELWAGDGTTQGGIKVTGIVPESLNDLSDVNLFVAPQVGQVLKWNGAAFVAADDNNTGTSNSGIIEGSSYNINIIRDDSTVMVNSLTGIFTGNLEGNVVGDLRGNVVGDLEGNVVGNLTGSVFSDYSTLLIDSVNGVFSGTFVGDAAGLTNFPADVGIVPGGNYNINIVGADSTLIINSDDNSLTTNNIYHSENALIIKNSNNLLRSVVEVESDNTLTRLVISRASAEIIDDTMVYGRLDFKKDDPNGPLVTAAIGADNLGLFFTYSSSGIGETESNYVTFSANSNFGIGTWTPTERLDVRGNASITGYVQFGSFSTVDRDSLTAVNGMVIYNSTANRFQGYQNNAWINLDDGSVA